MREQYLACNLPWRRHARVLVVEDVTRRFEVLVEPATSGRRKLAVRGGCQSRTWFPQGTKYKLFAKIASRHLKKR